MAKEKVYIRKPKKGLAYFPGNVVEMEKSKAKELYEDGTGRPATEVLPDDVPGRAKLLRRGIETLDDVKDLDNFQGLGLSVTEQNDLSKYFKGSNLPEDLPGCDAFEEAGIESVDEIKAMEDPTEVTGIGDATAKDLAEYFANQ